MAAQEKFDLIIRAKDEASAVVGNVNREVNRLAGSSLPKATTGLTGFSREALKAELKTAALGSRLAGINPIVNQFANAFLMGSPAVAALSLGLGALTAIVIENTNVMDKAVETIVRNRDALEALANSNNRYADTARELLGIRRQLAEQELRQAENTLALAQAGFREATWYERLTGSLPYVNTTKAQQTKITAELTAKISQLSKELGTLHAQMYGPTREDYERFIEQEKQAARDVAMLNRALRERAGLLDQLKPENFRGGAFSSSGFTGGAFGVPEDEVKRAKEDAERAMESIYAIPEEEQRALDDASQKWQEFSGMVLSSTDQLAAGITDMFFGLRDSLADVFKSMAANWVRYFINEILKQTALKLGLALFNVIFPGSGGLIGSAPGVGDVAVTPGLAKLSSGSGLDLVSAGAKRFSGGVSSASAITVNIQGDIIGDEQFVNKRIIPAIENAIRYQTTTIAGR